LLLRAADAGQARRIIERLAQAAARTPALTRRLVTACAAAGDPVAVPWLVKQMALPEFARCAGESFSVLTGVDLDATRLSRAAPEAEGPGGDADEEIVRGQDDGLPWPDAGKIAQWWRAEARRFVAGQRYFMGQALSREVCGQVLRDGVQRRRIAAAHYLCLLQPGSKLFPTAAPAWRQLPAIGK
jgi:uncharacterized protein (TIGR02270 family)